MISKRNPFRSAAITLAASALFVSIGRAQDPKRIDRIAQHYASRDGFSGTVTFAHAGAVLFRHGYGFADREHHASFNEHTRLSIGSVSKQFTAAAILLLQQDGKLKTSDSLGSLLADETPQAWASITIRQLLSHTSGLKDYASLAPPNMQLQEHPPADLLALVTEEPLNFQPGQGYAYSNTNYLLLGMILQKVSGTSFCTFLHRRLFDPLGMQDSQCLGEPGALEHHATGYAPVDPGEAKPLTSVPPAPVTASSFFFGAGSLVSTGDDLVRWATALHHGRVLTDVSYREMTTPVRNGYGYGLQLGTLRGHMRIDHSGSVQGFYSELEYFPETDNIAVLLSNQNALSHGMFTPGTHVIDSELMTVAADPNAPVPSENKEVVLSPRVLRLLAGKYTSDDSKTPPFTLYLKGDHLELLEDGPGHTPSQLRGDYGEMDFYLSDSEADMEFNGQNDAVIFDLRYSRAIPFHRVQP